jgi:hypothetical protein
MVHFWFSAILIFCASQSISSINVFEGTREELKLQSNLDTHNPLEDHNDFHCDLSLMPSQKKLMYYDIRVQKKEVTFDAYKWPKHDGLVTVPYRISQTSLFCK